MLSVTLLLFDRLLQDSLVSTAIFLADLDFPKAWQAGKYSFFYVQFTFLLFFSANWYFHINPITKKSHTETSFLITRLLACGWLWCPCSARWRWFRYRIRFVITNVFVVVPPQFTFPNLVSSLKWRASTLTTSWCMAVTVQVIICLCCCVCICCACLKHTLIIKHLWDWPAKSVPDQLVGRSLVKAFTFCQSCPKKHTIHPRCPPGHLGGKVSLGTLCFAI